MRRRGLEYFLELRWKIWVDGDVFFHHCWSMANKFDSACPEFNSCFRPGSFNILNSFFDFLFEVSHALGGGGVSGAELGFELLPRHAGITFMIADSIGGPAVKVNGERIFFKLRQMHCVKWDCAINEFTEEIFG